MLVVIFRLFENEFNWSWKCCLESKSGRRIEGERGEVESVVESVVQGERTVVASDAVEGGEAGDAAND